MLRRGIPLLPIALLVACSEPPLDPIDHQLLLNTVTIGGCEFDFEQGSATLHLLDDCTTAEFIALPDGHTLNGRDYTISAATPFSGSGVIQTAFGAQSGNVTRVNIDGGDQDGFAGILFGEGVSGTISQSAVTGTISPSIFLLSVENVTVAQNTLTDRGVFVTGGAKDLVISDNNIAIPPDVVVHGNGIRIEPDPVETLVMTGNSVDGGNNGIFFAESVVGLGTVEKNDLVGNRVGIALEGLQANTRLEVIGNHIRDAREYGLALINLKGTAPSDVAALLASNHVDGAGENGLFLSGVQGPGNDVVLQNNDVDNVGNHGILANEFTNGIRFEGNRVGAAGGNSCIDLSVGVGTEGTANTWVENIGETSVPETICVPEVIDPEVIDPQDVDPAELVNDLVNDGSLAEKDGKKLTKILEKADKELNKGKTDKAIKEVNKFIKEVGKLVDKRKLSPEDGQTLIDAANNVLDDLWAPVPLFMLVDDLVDEGSLDEKDAKKLVGTLEKVLKELDKGKTDKAIKELNKFIKEVDKLADKGKLRSDDGELLIDAARGMIDELNG